ncbi:hypothetical protein K458DRAFT_390271 [Lentithecium fluviatile CBS 122367]|uniref:PARP-type domain-containing protein n=1 Tax=Lentithecium fluviatile CBS 122367 TaxID=1168545 RepID=A0A6G1IYG9_9PLEO|nr:hypothetical protein K458DRAFT_390271 [Lentithecium fluviatile CBS 122367]
MILTTITKTTTTQALEGDDALKWRVEHSVSNKAVCYQAACKRVGVKIAKGELRLGTQSWFDTDQKYIRQGRHWGCVTKHQIESLKTLSGDNPDDVPGYAGLSPEQCLKKTERTPSGFRLRTPRRSPTI